MPPYQIQLDEALRHGLKRDSRVPKGALALDQCDYLRPTEYGLKDFLAITQDIEDADLTPGSETWTYPYPQLFRGAYITLLCFSDAVYEVDESTWTATKLALYDAADFGDAVPGDGSISAGGPWHFVDYHSTWILFNGVTTIWKTGYYMRPIATSAVTITTGCDLKGRMFMGGFDPTDFYALADWPSYWEDYFDNAPEEIRQRIIAMQGGAGSNWVWWGTIGGGDLLWLVSRDLMTGGSFAATEEMLTNGDFTGDAASWTLGSNWAYSSNSVSVTAAPAGWLSQTLPNMVYPVEHNKDYILTFTVSNRTAGSISASLNGGTFGTSRSTNGTFTETLTSSSLGVGLVFDPDFDFDGTIDDVSLHAVPGDHYSATVTPWNEMIQRNEFGMCPLPWQGTVLNQKRLGDTVICYGDGGMTALVPFSAPVAGMAPMDLHGIGMGVGLASRSAVGGSYDEHVFVDNAGELWRLGTDLVATRIGYGYIFADLLGSEIMVHHDPHRREYYITGYNGSSYECYVLTPTGLGRAPFVPTSLHFLEGGLIGILQGSTAAGAEIITNRFGGSQPKAIDEVESVTLTSFDENATGWSVYVQYRFDKGAAWSESSAVVTDQRGYARMNISGLEFRVRLTHPDRTECDLDGLMVEMKSSGKRSLSPLT